MNKYVGLLSGIGALAGIIYVILCPTSPVYGWLQKDRYKVIGNITKTYPLERGNKLMNTVFIFDTSTGVVTKEEFIDATDEGENFWEFTITREQFLSGDGNRTAKDWDEFLKSFPKDGEVKSDEDWPVGSKFRRPK